MKSFTRNPGGAVFQITQAELKGLEAALDRDLRENDRAPSAYLAGLFSVREAFKSGSLELVANAANSASLATHLRSEVRSCLRARVQ